MAFGKLTATKVAGKLKPGRHSDGAGLYLHVDEKGSKRWIYRFTVAGKTSEKGLGPLSDVTLAEAREKAAEARKVVKNGISPVTAAKTLRVARSRKPTFGEIAAAYIENHRPSWKSQKHADQWATHINTHCAAILDLPITELTTAHVVSVLQPIWTKTPEAAGRVRNRIELVWDSAQAMGVIDENRSNPARLKGRIDKLLPKLQKLSRGHHPALPYEKLPGFMAELRATNTISARCLEFIILTAVRSNEARSAEWSEIDLAEKVWTIPKSRMKAGKEHRVPLCARALEIIDDMKPLKQNTLLFPGTRDKKPLADVTIDMLLRRMGVKYATDGSVLVTTHGFRSSFRDWVKEKTEFQREIAEAALAHAVGDAAEQAYSRRDALEKRRVMMGAWEAFCAGKSA